MNGHKNSGSEAGNLSRCFNDRQGDVSHLALQKRGMLHRCCIDKEAYSDDDSHPEQPRLVIESDQDRRSHYTQESKRRSDGNVDPEQCRELFVGG